MTFHPLPETVASAVFFKKTFEVWLSPDIEPIVGWDGKTVRGFAKKGVRRIHQNRIAGEIAWR